VNDVVYIWIMKWLWMKFCLSLVLFLYYMLISLVVWNLWWEIFELCDLNLNVGNSKLFDVKCKIVSGTMTLSDHIQCRSMWRHHDRHSRRCYTSVGHGDVTMNDTSSKTINVGHGDVIVTDNVISHHDRHGTRLYHCRSRWCHCDATVNGICVTIVNRMTSFVLVLYV
jgi:hypothetical protein